MLHVARSRLYRLHKSQDRLGGFVFSRLTRCQEALLPNKLLKKEASQAIETLKAKV